MAYLTTTEAATKLGVTPSRVRKMAQSGRLVAERFGRDWRISEKAVAAVADRKSGRPPKAKSAAR